MYKLAVIGDSESILAFQAVGMDAYLVTKEKAEETLRKQFRSGKYAIIFLAESLAVELIEYLHEIGKKPFPAVTILPLSHETLGMGLERMKTISIRASGTDVISKTG